MLHPENNCHITPLQQQQILLKIRNISNYISFPPKIAYKLIESLK